MSADQTTDHPDRPSRRSYAARRATCTTLTSSIEL